jgi:hypothetical protein
MLADLIEGACSQARGPQRLQDFEGQEDGANWVVRAEVAAQHQQRRGSAEEPRPMQRMGFLVCAEGLGRSKTDLKLMETFGPRLEKITWAGASTVNCGQNGLSPTWLATRPKRRSVELPSWIPPPHT